MDRVPDASEEAAASSKRPWNPLAPESMARKGSSYLGLHHGRLAHLLEPARLVCAGDEAVHTILRQHVLSEGYPCVGARSAFNRARYRFGVYPQLATRMSALALVYDLYEFGHEFEGTGDEFVTFLAVFHSPVPSSEAHFEELLWQHLSAMHDIDTGFFDWASSASNDVDNVRFAFSIGGRAYFIVGMHPQASRRARMVPFPVLTFNLHEQFERLRQRGKFETMKTMIQSRDMAFQGSVNPMSTSFGDKSEAGQYAGRVVPADWQCPFHVTNQKHEP